MMKRFKEEYDTTSNSRVYSIAKKRVHENAYDISCSLCPYHKGDNNTWWRKHRNWKINRQTQYKLKEYDLI